ncbi:MAG: hypothetical protein JST83_00165 [Bacteroidetes bacterium]|nr:hypothetical protein [Bacteroidota bacterium]
MPASRITEAGRALTSPRVARYIAGGIILLGIVMRLAVYMQNRNLFIDEANIARNVYERGFGALAQPLSYEQYAPPVFLWVVKVSAILFGYREQALKLFPLLCGLLSLGLLYRILLLMDIKRAAWYPLILFATGHIYLRYATELKQYSSDALVALALVWLALIADIRTLRCVRFVVLWTLCGSLAIWISMPSVFLLATAGIYYLVILWRDRDYARIWIVLIPALAWLSEFGYYYLTILRPEAESAYLQNFHRNAFIYLPPHTAGEWLYDGNAVIQILGVAAGHWTLSLIFHLICLGAAMAVAIRSRQIRLILVAMPLFFLLCAAGLHKFSLLPRVILFVMPLLLVWIGLGLEALLSLRLSAMILLPVSAICLINYGQLHYLWQPLLVTEVTDCLIYMQQHSSANEKFYIEGSAVPAYVYYTEIHPDRGRWSALRGATCLPYAVDMDPVASAMPDSSMVLISYQEPDVIRSDMEALDRHMKTEDVYKGRSVGQVVLLRKR